MAKDKFEFDELESKLRNDGMIEPMNTLYKFYYQLNPKAQKLIDQLIDLSYHIGREDAASQVCDEIKEAVNSIRYKY